MAEKNNIRRTRIFLNHPLQNQYILHIIIAALIPMVVLFLNVYLLIWISVTQYIGAGEPNLVIAFDRVNSFVLLEIPLVLLFLFLWAIYISHKLVGPLLRLEIDLNKMLEGEHGLRIQLRDSDQKEIKDIVETLNKVLELKNDSLRLN